MGEFTTKNKAAWIKNLINELASLYFSWKITLKFLINYFNLKL